jgi:hypothetical protein
MARITTLPLATHLRADESRHVHRYRTGQVVGSRRGLSYWFRPLDTAIAGSPRRPGAAVPATAAAQSESSQGIVAGSPAETLATRIDFGIDPRTGATRTPIEQLLID